MKTLINTRPLTFTLLLLTSLLTGNASAIENRLAENGSQRIIERQRSVLDLAENGSDRVLAAGRS